jgi:nucleotide-binding universal stress UspA family protein
MLERILIPIDGSEIFDETIHYIENLADRNETEIVLLHVIAEDDTSSIKQEASEHELLQKHYTELARHNWKVVASLRKGDPVKEISSHAVELPASLIVMSTHGRSGLENIREGSVTEQVVRQSPCPVFILHSSRPDTESMSADQIFRRVLVPLDGSEVSASILPCVEKFAKRYHAEVVLFHDDLECEGERSIEKRREVLETHGVNLANHGVPVVLECSANRRPVHEILNRIADMDIDIVAMATHGSGGERRALEDSVTANVMRHADRPMLVWSSDPQCPPGALL